MASHHVDMKDEKLQLGERAWPAYSAGLFLGFIGILASVAIGYYEGDGFRRFYFSWLTALVFFLAIGLGGLFFVILQHLVRAEWSVTVRRTAENIAASTWILFVLSAPVLLSVVLQKGDLYRWAQPLPAHDSHAMPAGHHEGDGHDHSSHAADAHAPASPASADKSHDNHADAHAGDSHGDSHGDGAHGAHAAGSKAIPPLDELTLKKRAWLNPTFFVIRIVFYFAFWSLIGWWFWRKSVLQDQTRQVELTSDRETVAAPLMLLFAITLTFGIIDLMMSLDPHWFSTMYPVVYFSNAAMAIFATLIIFSKILQKKGFVTESISVEHYHDLGKFLFAFTFFYGYVAFSQFMLLWYANLPETTAWFARRGASSQNGLPQEYYSYTVLLMVLVFGHFIIPFAGLLSRHVKRNGFGLTFFAGWQLVMVYVDFFWLIMPEFEPSLRFHILDLTCLIGIGGLWIATVVRTAARHALRPTADPRLNEALAFHNI